MKIGITRRARKKGIKKTKQRGETYLGKKLQISMKIKLRKLLFRDKLKKEIIDSDSKYWDIAKDKQKKSDDFDNYDI